ncbi:MAG: carbonic anhydrase [Mangrovibacterium sp.]
MNKRMMVVAALMVLLLCETSSCTSKSENASTPSAEAQHFDSISAEGTVNPLADLIQGNARFVEGKLMHDHQDVRRIKELEAAQHPKSVIISCSDSRVPPEIIFDQGLGDLFTIRTAGNVMDDFELGSVEYAVEHLHTKLVVVMGHEGCGAIAAMIDHAKHGEQDSISEHGFVPDHISTIVEALEGESEAIEALKNTENLSGSMVRANVTHGVKQLRTSEPILSKMYAAGEIEIIGAVYHLDTGKVELIEIL